MLLVFSLITIYMFITVYIYFHGVCIMIMYLVLLSNLKMHRHQGDSGVYCFKIDDNLPILETFEVPV